MKHAQVVPMKAPKQLMEKLRFGSRVLRPGTEGVALPVADRSKPDLAKVELDAHLFKAEARLSDEVLEDSIERGQLKQTIMVTLGEAIARDMDEVIIQGDTLSADPFLAVMDGILKQATSNLVDAGGAQLSKSTLRDMIKAMPSEYLRDRRKMAYFTSVDAEADWRDSLADRATGLGDKWLSEDGLAPYNATKVYPVPMMPENLAPGANKTNALYTDPKNIAVGIWRNIKLESDRDISAGVLRIVATLRFDVKYVEETAVVRAWNLAVA